MSSKSPDVFQLAFEHASTPLAIVDFSGGSEGVGVAANRAWRELFAIAADPRGLPLEELVPSARIRTQLVRLATGTGSGADHAAVNVAEVDERRPPGVAMSPLGAYQLVELRELRDEQDIIRELQQSEKWLQAIVDNTSNTIYIKDLDGRYVFFNRAWEEYFAHLAANPIGLTDEQIYPPATAGQVRANDLHVLELGAACEFEERAPSPTGYRTFLSLKFPLLDDAGSQYAVAGISTDITARTEAELALREAQAETERANAAKNEFLSRMSHELRTPLNSILGYAQLLRDEQRDTSAQVPFDRILGAGEHLLSLINEVLDLTRIEAGQYDIALAPVSACEPLREALDLIRPQARERGIELSSDTHAGLFQFVLADQQRLVQVLLNLLGNAVKYNRRGGHVHVSFARDREQALRYLVYDDGPGVDGDSAKRMFTPFERLGAERSETEGTGLGLAVSKALVEAMGGSIGLGEPPPGGGATFYVELPLTQCEDGVEKTLFPDSGDGERRGQSLPSGTVLYVEDNDYNVDVVARLLEHESAVRFVAAPNGHRGIALARRHRPNLVLLDLNLPDMPGEEVLRRLKAWPVTATIPVVVVSADATPRQAQRLEAAGAAAYLTKPLDLARLRDVMAVALTGGGE